jgi:hypothetical protein
MVKNIIRRENAYSLLLLFLIITGLVLYFYSPVLFHPNAYLFSGEGDGIKSYYSSAYHIKHDTGFYSFKGMNYPYGEHYLYTDGYPAISNTIKLLSGIFPHISNYTIGIMNFIMLLSIIITAFIYYSIFKHFKLSNIGCVLSAVSVTLLAPQLFRMTGHFSLSFSFIIPLSWYLYILYRKTKRKYLHTLILSTAVFLWFFIHAYLGLIVVMFILTISIIDLLFDFRNTIKNKHKLFQIGIQTFLPVILFQLFMTLTDTHENRSPDPWGIWNYMATPNSVFVPIVGYTRHILDGIIKIGPQKWEGWAYIGLPSTFLFIFLIIYIFGNTIRRKFRSIKESVNTEWMLYLIASIVMLLYSFGVPYKTGMAFLLDWFPVLKQFRSLGRFAWIFYYVFTAFSLYFFFKQVEKLKIKNYLKYVILSVIWFIYILEGLGHHKFVSSHIGTTPNSFNSELQAQYFKPLLSHIESEKYQAIIPLPFYHGYSGEFERPSTSKTLRFSLLLSYYTGLPTISSSTSRTSKSESKKIVQLLSPTFIEKEIKKDFPNKKPFLLLYTNEELTENEKTILQKSVFLNDNADLGLYLLPFDSLFVNEKEKYITAFERNRHKMIQMGSFYVNDTNAHFIYESFDTLKTNIHKNGTGALQGLRKKYVTIKSFPERTFKPGIEYMVTVWFENTGWSKTQSSITIEEKFDNKVEWIKSARPMDSEIIEGEWTMVTLSFNVKNEKSLIKIFSKGNDRSKDTLYMDELLIRQKNDQIYRIQSVEGNNIKELFYNGFYISNK